MQELSKWRLILGKEASSGDLTKEDALLSASEQEIDNILDTLYESSRQGSLADSSPKVSRWLGDIRKFFPKEVVKVLQHDALDRLDLKQLLLEPEVLEEVTPDVELVATLLSLKNILPQKSKETARLIVEKVVKDLEKRLSQKAKQALVGSVNRCITQQRPRQKDINWKKTIEKNLKHYQKDYNTIIPEKIIGYSRKSGIQKKIILCIDQSGSMATSVVYAGVLGAVLASIKTLQTHVVAFDTSVVDLTEFITDPVELLFGTQLGGGTDINKAMSYVSKLITTPKDTIIVLISDLFEGGNEHELLSKVAILKQSGVSFVTLLALNDEGTPFYNKDLASKFLTLDIASFACTPNQFAETMSSIIEKKKNR